MWLKWFPWRFIIKHMAHTHGFLDPFSILSRLSRFAQPSEVIVPVELLRAGAVLHARGLINSQAIQHNLDWIWPYWVEQQFNPKSKSFIPRAFSFTHINLTHRNWTAIGMPNFSGLPIVDPRGLVTPIFDGWSLDSWIIIDHKTSLVPSRMASVSQQLSYNKNLSVATKFILDGVVLESKAEVIIESGMPICRISLAGNADSHGWLAVSLRPYNPEGISFIHEIAMVNNGKGWRVNNEYDVLFHVLPDRCLFSNYHAGDVYHSLLAGDKRSKIQCDVGMATAAALFNLQPGRGTGEVVIDVPLETVKKPLFSHRKLPSCMSWEQSTRGVAELSVPDKRIQFLYESAIRTLVLHSPGTIYAGPYTYKRFWFRDAAFILHALLCTGLSERAEKILDTFPAHQTASGYFRSQEGEWDSNGQVLWIMHRFCELTGKRPKAEWQSAIRSAARWIKKKRLTDDADTPHAGLLPPGFSAEHLGPSDYYYWDDFWSVTGLRAAASLMDLYEECTVADEFSKEANSLLSAIERSLETAAERTGRPAMPASPYRRMDSGAIGSLAAGYPLQLWEPRDFRLLDTVEYLISDCLIDGGFFHDMIHSGINPYLTLHIAQVLLRAGESRFFYLMSTIAGLATSAGQWPEAIHPHTKGGCMGDGQHVWAAAEWILMVKNCFIREENDGRLILCSGIPPIWYRRQATISFGPVLTAFGKISVSISSHQRKTVVAWEGIWHKEEPHIEVHLAGYEPFAVKHGQRFAEFIFVR